MNFTCSPSLELGKKVFFLIMESLLIIWLWLQYSYSHKGTFCNWHLLPILVRDWVAFYFLILKLTCRHNVSDLCLTKNAIYPISFILSLFVLFYFILMYVCVCVCWEFLWDFWSLFVCLLRPYQYIKTVDRCVQEHELVANA